MADRPRASRRNRSALESRGESRRLNEIFNPARDVVGDERWNPENRGNHEILAERVAATAELLAGRALWPPRGFTILEVGCGTGGELARFGEWGAAVADLVGIDLVEHRVRTANAVHPGLRLVVGDGFRLPIRSQSVRLVVLATVLTSVLDRRRTAGIASEVDRVLVQGGCVLWYDFRVSSPRNRDTRGIGRRGLRRLFPTYDIVWKRVTLLPPLARRLGRHTATLYSWLSKPRFMRTHYLALLVKPPGRERANRPE